MKKGIKTAPSFGPRRTNCPNCGAPIDGIICQYCGTRIYDFINISEDEPVWICFRYDGMVVQCKTKHISSSVACENVTLYADDKPYIKQPDYTITLDFKVVQDENGVYFTVARKESE